ncbi:hypothetical protein [Mycobacterium sp.]|uniref:hypothetical protein n=1 Tax=Mycobacterium sp. TaxID=1785 RepID=UPI002D4BE38A|nr:hypothetical protein [Mycobacterium sp.]HZA11029.1 hypothetical protein [Mycobacterium sp.]
MTVTRTTMDPETRRHARAKRPVRWATTEHVVYRYNPGATPCFSFHSLPHGCIGVADTLNDARTSYRSCMTSLLALSRRELPPVAEHLEAVVAGMWVRAKIGAVHRAPHSDRMFLQILLSEGHGQAELRAHVEDATTTGAGPVVVIVEPDDTMGLVLDQMRAADALLVVHSDPRTVLGWVTVYGPDASGAGDAFHLANHAGFRQLSINEITRAYAGAGLRDVRLPRQLFSDARSAAGSCTC